jgi:uncharacterized metal-binding protein YceD (DUF177 family)
LNLILQIQPPVVPLQPDFQNLVAMDPFVPYSIPIQGLKNGIHRFKYRIDQAFFRLFEDSPVEEGAVDFEVELDKRPGMFLLDFSLKGSIRAECDRCTASIDLPIEDERQLIVKYGETEGEEEDEVVFIHPETSSFNLAKYLYEFTVLAMPITNAYDCENDPEPPCNFEVLKFLENEASEGKTNSVWDALKGLDKEN